MKKIVIIGSGPAGLSAAIYASRAMLNPLVIEGVAGGQLMLTTEVENYPGYENPILGPVLMDQFKKQALRFNTRFKAVNVTDVIKDGEYIKVKFSDGSELLTESLLITTGADAKWLGIESEQRLRGKGVSACATCDGFFFKDKKVAVVGGGDTAMEEALFLTKFASEVTIIHRRNEFRASKIMQQKVFNNPKIKVLYECEVMEVLGDEKVTGLKLKQKDGQIEMPFEGLFLAIGHTPATSFLFNSGVKLDEKGYIMTREEALISQINVNEYPLEYRHSTNIKGIFAAGDCVDHEFRQAVTAAGMAVEAVLEIEKYLTSFENE